MSIEDAIMSTFARVAEEQGRRLARLTHESKLSECGLDSLGFTLVILSLEQSLKIDPFDSAEDIDFPVTIRDFIALYARHGASASAGPALNPCAGKAPASGR